MNPCLSQGGPQGGGRIKPQASCRIHRELRRTVMPDIPQASSIVLDSLMLDADTANMLPFIQSISGT